MDKVNLTMVQRASNKKHHVAKLSINGITLQVMVVLKLNLLTSEVNIPDAGHSSYPAEDWALQPDPNHMRPYKVILGADI